MRIRVEQHSDYELLDADEVTDLCDRAKLDLRVGFEIEMHYRDASEDMHGPGYDGADVLNDIQAAFEKKYGFTMATETFSSDPTMKSSSLPIFSPLSL